MKVVYLLYFALYLALRAAAEGTNVEDSVVTHRHDWKLVRSVPASIVRIGEKPTLIYYVVVPEVKIRDIMNYEAAAEAIAGTNNCSIYFWTDRDRSLVPTSDAIPVRSLQKDVAEYNRYPGFKPPYLRLACWLYPSEEAARHANAFFNPDVKMPSSETH
jgi:hypothetical protein